MPRRLFLLVATGLMLALLLPTPDSAARRALAQDLRIAPQDVMLQPSDLPPGFTVVDESTEPLATGDGILHSIGMERPADEAAYASGPTVVTQTIARFGRPGAYSDYLDRLRRAAVEQDGYEYVPNAPNDGGTASLQRFDGAVAAFQVGFLKYDMVIFTTWIGRRGVVTLPGLLRLAGVSSARYDEVATDEPQQAGTVANSTVANSASASSAARRGSTRIPSLPQPTPAAGLVTAPRSARTTAGGSITTTYIHQQIAAPTNDVEFACLSGNPSCGRDPWWAERNEVQGDEFVQFSFLAPGLIAEARFTEAVWLLWQWDDGKALLRTAAEFGVLVLALHSFEDNFAYYRPYSQVLVVGKNVAATPTWMMSAVLAHELQHVTDHRSGARMGKSSAECLARERAAYNVERRFLSWISARFNGLPSESIVAGRFSEADLQLYANLHEIGTAPDLDAVVQRDYRQGCAA